MLETIRDKYNKINLSSKILIFITFIFVITGNLKFTENDDTFIMSIASGAYGQPNEYLVYINIIIGWLLEKLYSIFPYINHYSLFLILVNLFSFMSISKILINKDKYRNKYIDFTKILIIVILYTRIIFQFTYTTVAYVSLIAGFMYLFYGLEKECDKYKTYIKGYSYIILGILIRIQTVLPALVIAFVYILINIFKTKKVRSIFIIVSVVSVTIIISTLTSFYYDKSEHAEYNRFNEARSNILDKKQVDYLENKEEFEKLGFSENDYNLLYGWVFTDKEVFSTENLEKIVEMNTADNKYEWNFKFIINKLVNSITDSFKYKHVHVLILTILLVTVMILNRKNIIYAIMIFMSAFATNFIFYFIQRPVDRVVVPNYIFASILLIFIFDFKYAEKFIRNLKFDKKNKIKPTIILVIFNMIMLFSTTPLYAEKIMYDRNESKMYTKDNIELLEYLKENRENLYIGTGGQYEWMLMSVPILENYAKDYKVNFINDGGWETYHETYYEILNRHEIENKDRLLLSLLEEENVYYLVSPGTENHKLIEIYLEEHTGKNVEYELVDTVKNTGFSIYKYTYIN